MPLEQRNERLVVEDGKLHIYRDFYNQGTITEENLRAVLDAHGISLDAITDAERSHVMETMNVVSRHPKKQPTPVPTPTQTPMDRAAIAAARKAEAERQKKLRSQKEFVLEISALTSKGYPAAVNLDSGTRSATPANQSTPNR